MVDTTRTDPVEILARVSQRDGQERAFDVWVHKATKAGWSVTVESTSLDQPGTECGVVNIDGLRYRIHHGKRVRQRVAMVPAGQHVIAAIAKSATGQAVDGLTWSWEFGDAAWAEPVLSDEAA